MAIALLLTGALVFVPGHASAGVSMSEAAAVRAGTVSGAAPVMSVLTDMSLKTGETADQALQATDADGDPLTFSKSAGPDFMTVTTTDPGAGTATGNVHLAPGPSDTGSYTVIVQVTDGSLFANRKFRVDVSNAAEVAPVLAPIANMSLRGGETKDQALSASDDNGDPLTFTKLSGPSYMTVYTIDENEGTGLVRLAPPSGTAGTPTGAVQVSDGTLSDQQTFFITVTSNTAPVLYYPSSMYVAAGDTANQIVYAYDNDGDALTFYKVSGPGFMLVSTISSTGGNGTGLVHLAPQDSDIGSFNGTVAVSDGLATDQKPVYISVSPRNRPPVLAQPLDMTMVVGELAEQTVTATDPDFDYVTFTKISGPAFVTLSSYYSSNMVTISARPGAGDVGTASVTISASDYSHTVTASFMVTVQAGNFPELCPSNSFLTSNLPVGSGLIEVQSADLNGDGALDLVAELADEDRVAVLLGVGDGTFSDPLYLAAGDVPASGAIGDFNGDDVPDIAIANFGYSSTNNISIFLGDGSGGFGQRRDINCGGRVRSVVTGDLNRDGKLDLVATRLDLGSLAVLRGAGNGTFASPTSVTTGASPWVVQLGDLDRDGDLDAVVVNGSDSDISVLLNVNGNLGSRADYSVPTPLGLAVGDLNEDGKPDVAVTSGQSYYVSVFLGNGNGSLGMKRSFPTGDRPSLITIADVNGDDHADLATANFYGSSASILLGSGTGAFAPRTDVPTSYNAYGIAAGDFDDDLRTDLVVASTSGSLTFIMNQCAPHRDHPPVVKAPKSSTTSEGVQVTVAVTASDPDGPAIATLTANVAGLPLGHNATFVTDPGNSSGTFRWTPGYMDARPTPYSVTFTASNNLSGSASTKILVLNSNRAPVASAGGPYTAFIGAPLGFNGSGSVDPDGDAIVFSWTYGDGSTGNGPNPVHTYTATGVFGVALTVTDGTLYSVATTTATIVEMLQARAFTSNGNKSIKLSAGKRRWCVDIEPVGRSFANVEVDLSTLLMKSAGTGSVSEIHAITDKSALTVDRDGNGIPEIEACFLKDDLRLLFGSMHGTSTVTVSLEGRLFAGGVFRTQIDLLVTASGGGNLAASISPNPLNPDAVLTFHTEAMSTAQVDLYDVRGRLVRRLLEQEGLPAGYHDVRIDGRNDNGEKLASGIYFFRVRAGAEEMTGQFAILK
ncbi:MAG TPA: FG-GAP-like repeat-containing protein [Tepidiformaceae bacterium]|nr:FG-GAP-like repeat-containing protein [Tepidiformaceae bacterium]